jgi:deoxyribonuclease IV
MFAELKREVGLASLKAVHLNDSKRELGSRVDRHARPGQGHLGLATFRRLVNDRRLRGVPLVLETPGPLSEWKKDITLLKGLRRRAPARMRALA